MVLGVTKGGEKKDGEPEQFFLGGESRAPRQGVSVVGLGRCQESGLIRLVPGTHSNRKTLSQMIGNHLLDQTESPSVLHCSPWARSCRVASLPLVFLSAILAKTIHGDGIGCSDRDRECSTTIVRRDFPIFSIAWVVGPAPQYPQNLGILGLKPNKKCSFPRG